MGITMVTRQKTPLRHDSTSPSVRDISLRCSVSTAVAAQHCDSHDVTMPSEQHSNAYPSLHREAVVGRQHRTACCRWQVHDFFGGKGGRRSGLAASQLSRERTVLRRCRLSVELVASNVPHNTIWDEVTDGTALQKLRFMSQPSSGRGRRQAGALWPCGALYIYKVLPHYRGIGPFPRTQLGENVASPVQLAPSRLLS